jgi:hypothetical protein
VVAAAQGLVVETQFAPDKLTDPLVQVAVAVPENPEALFVTEALWLCVRAPYGKVQLPEVIDPAPQALVVKVHVAPDKLTDPLVQVAVAVPENPEALFVTEEFWLWVRAPTGKVQEPLVSVVAAQPTGAALTKERFTPHHPRSQLLLETPFRLLPEKLVK